MIVEQTIKHNPMQFETMVAMVFEMETAIVIEAAIVIEMAIMIELFLPMLIEFVAMMVMLVENIVKMLIDIATMKFLIGVKINGVEIKRGINSDQDTMAMIENTTIEDTIVEVLTTGTGQVGSTSPQSKMVEIAETKIENDTVKQYEQESSTRRTR